MIYFEIVDYRHGKTIILTKIMESNRLQSIFFEKKTVFHNNKSSWFYFEFCHWTVGWLSGIILTFGKPR